MSEQEMEELEEEEEAMEPDESDLVCHDSRTRGVDLDVYQDGKLVLEIGYDQDRDAALREYMKRDGFYPNCWFISDHGNAILLHPWEGGKE